jgi:hypothetical protein
MKKFLWRFSPFIVGVLIALIIFNPPKFLRSIGWQGYLVLPVLCLLYLFIFSPGYMFIRSVYRKFELIPLATKTKTEDICPLTDTLASLGFTPAGPALELPHYAAIIVPFVHKEADTYCTITRVRVGFGRTIFAFSSIFEDNSGGLSTFCEHFSAMEPGPAGSFRQVFKGADLKSNFIHHLKGLEYLQKYGFNTRKISSETFLEDETKAIIHRKEFLRRNLIRNTITFVWRVLIKRTPYGGPIEKQKIAQKSLRVLNREPVSVTDTKSDLRRKIIADIEIMPCQIPTILRHSGLGIASFMISMVIIGLVLFLVFLAAILAIISPDLAELNSMLTRLLAAFLMIASLANLVGLVLGIAGMKQIGRKKMYPILGLVFNLMFIAGMIVIMIIGRLAS